MVYLVFRVVSQIVIIYDFFELFTISQRKYFSRILPYQCLQILYQIAAN